MGEYIPEVNIGSGFESISQLSMGAETTCVISSSSGLLKCWGLNSDGQLGLDILFNSLLYFFPYFSLF